MKVLKAIGKAVLPRRVRRWVRWQQARRAGVVETSGSVPERTCVIDLSDDCTRARLRHWYDGSVVEREQSPAVSLFRDPAFDYLELARDLHTVRFRGVSLDWVRTSGVWPPTLDSYIMVAALADAWPREDQRFWEVGCGTGIIGLHLLKLTPCHEGLLTDVDPRAVEHTRRNAEQLEITNMALRVEEFPPSAAAAEPFDLLVSNPPYFLPGFDTDRSRDGQANDDRYLTRALLVEGLEHARRVVVGYSSVMLDYVERHVDEARAADAEWDVLAKVRIPLTVTLADPTPRAEAGIFTDERDPRFPLWHDFYVGELRRPGVPARGPLAATSEAPVRTSGRSD